MSISRILLISFLAMFSLPGFAEELTPAKQADIEKLLDVTHAMQIGQQMSAATVNQMTKILHAAHPDIPARVLATLPEEVNAVISENIGSFKAIMVVLYDKYFTASEITQMLDFYSSPLGQKTIRVMPALVGESMQAGQQWGQALGPLIQQRIKARFKKQGYEI